jgi:hypothetical protein
LVFLTQGIFMLAVVRLVLLTSMLALLTACGTNEAASVSDGSGVLLDETTDVQGGSVPGDDGLSGGGGLADVELDGDATTPVPVPDDGGTVDARSAIETLCGDGIDNDFDGNVDCSDPDCLSAPECAGLADSEFNCVDGVDNDGNGAVDCADEACVRSPICRAAPDADAGADGSDAGSMPTDDAGTMPETDAGAPPAPDAGGGGGGGGVGFEFQCGDSIDNDDDGSVDCDDADCTFIPPCLGGGGGGGGTPPIPFEFQCGDGIDNDADGAVDCDDDNCDFIPPCLGR